MKRSAGVTVIAVLSLIGSGLTLLFAILMAALAALIPVPTTGEVPLPPAFFRGILAGVSLMYGLLAVWGIASGVGLLKLKNWARISTIVFSLLLLIVGTFSALGVLLIPAFSAQNAPPNPSVMIAIWLCMGAFWLAQAGIGLWWLVFLNRVTVKQQFLRASLAVGPPPMSSVQTMESGPVPPMPLEQLAPQRPISLTVIAWILIVGCLFIPLNGLLHTPTFLLTKIVTGRAAAIYFLVVGAFHLYVGVGLLRLKILARRVGVGYFAFTLVNGGVFYLAPGMRARTQALLDAQFAMFPWMKMWQAQSGVQFNLMPSIMAGACMGLVFVLLPLYFLVTRKEAFERAANLRKL